jgi:hypothetical protein
MELRLLDIRADQLTTYMVPKNNFLHLSSRFLPLRGTIRQELSNECPSYEGPERPLTYRAQNQRKDLKRVENSL